MICFNRFRQPSLYGMLLFAVLLGGCQTSQLSAVSESAPPPPPPPSIVAEPVVVCPEPEITVPVEPLPALECPKIEIPACPVCPAARIGTKIVIGEIEQVTVKPLGFKYLARIDTGATSTSIHATNVTRFERDGERWVRFQIDNPRSDEAIMLERPLSRKIRVKQSEEDDRRLVVILTLTIGKITRHVEVSLTDRSQMEFPVLIGRNFLRDAVMVDVSQREIAR